VNFQEIDLWKTFEAGADPEPGNHRLKRFDRRLHYLDLGNSTDKNIANPKMPGFRYVPFRSSKPLHKLGENRISTGSGLELDYRQSVHGTVNYGENRLFNHQTTVVM
jgi:hypothetical protein